MRLRFEDIHGELHTIETGSRDEKPVIEKQKVSGREADYERYVIYNPDETDIADDGIEIGSVVFNKLKSTNEVIIDDEVAECLEDMEGEIQYLGAYETHFLREEIVYSNGDNHLQYYAYDLEYEEEAQINKRVFEVLKNMGYAVEIND